MPRRRHLGSNALPFLFRALWAHLASGVARAILTQLATMAVGAFVRAVAVAAQCCPMAILTPGFSMPIGTQGAAMSASFAPAAAGDPLILSVSPAAASGSGLLLSLGTLDHAINSLDGHRVAGRCPATLPAVALRIR